MYDDDIVNGGYMDILQLPSSRLPLVCLAHAQHGMHASRVLCVHVCYVFVCLMYDTCCRLGATTRTIHLV